MSNPLVSIITPCYNGERFLKSLFDSINNQSYSPIEFILIDDQSTDSSFKTAEELSKMFNPTHVSFTHIKMEKKGYVGGAVNAGLKIFNGDYLMCLDCDDTLHPDFFKIMVNGLEAHPEYGFAMCQGQTVNGNDKSIIYDVYIRRNHKRRNFFKDIVNSHNVFFSPGIYLHRTEAFLSVNPSRSIFPSRHGQNLQLLMPMAYKYKCLYIKKILFNWSVFPESLSHKERTYNERLEQIRGYDEIMRNVAYTMIISDAERAQILRLIARKNNLSHFLEAYKNDQYEDLEIWYHTILEKGELTPFIIILYLRKKNKFINLLFMELELMKKFIKQIIIRILKHR